MRIVGLRLRDFRSYAAAEVRFGPGVTVVHGRNGAGKTNLLEAIYLGCTGGSWRSASDRELVRFDADVARVELEADAADGPHVLSVGIEPGQRRRLRADGAAVERMADVASRPLAAVFLPDRLELVKGGPALRRAHVDQVVAALWPARAATATSSGASRRMAPIATIFGCHATGATCAPSARRASSAWPCWRCCSPNARRSAPCAAPRR